MSLRHQQFLNLKSTIFETFLDVLTFNLKSNQNTELNTVKHI